MPIRPLTPDVFPDPAALVDVLDDDVRHLILDLIDTAADEEVGALSAPEVGINRQVLVVRSAAPDGGETTFLAMINPTRCDVDGATVFFAFDHVLAPVMYRPDAAATAAIEDSYEALLGAAYSPS